MKLILLLFSLFCLGAVKYPDPGLPFEQDLTIVNLEKLPRTQNLQLNFLLEIPLDHKLNPGAPSAVGIYEKIGQNKWQLTDKISLTEFSVIGSELHFKKQIHLNSDNSDVALFSTIFHCRKDGTRCQIQGFKSKMTRLKDKSPLAKVDFNIQAVIRD